MEDEGKNILCILPYQNSNGEVSPLGGAVMLERQPITAAPFTFKIYREKLLCDAAFI